MASPPRSLGRGAGSCSPGGKGRAKAAPAQEQQDAPLKSLASALGGRLQSWWGAALRRLPASAAGAADSPAPRSPPAIYGLARGEAEPVAGSDDSDGNEATAEALRRLQRSPEFAAHLASKRMTPEDVDRTAERLRLYRRLRRLDPAGFWALAGGRREDVDTQAPTCLQLGAEYLLSLALSVLVLSTCAYWLAASGDSAYFAAHPAALWTARCACCGLAWELVLSQWAAGRPAAGRFIGICFEELQWGHAPPAWRGLASGVIDVAYAVSTLGVGVVVSLLLRVGSERRQSVGELCARVRAVREVQISAPAA